MESIARESGKIETGSGALIPSAGPEPIGGRFTDRSYINGGQRLCNELCTLKRFNWIRPNVVNVVRRLYWSLSIKIILDFILIDATHELGIRSNRLLCEFLLFYLLYLSFFFLLFLLSFSSCLAHFQFFLPILPI